MISSSFFGPLCLLLCDELASCTPCWVVVDHARPGEALEQGVMLATKIHDDSLFERCFVQLKPFYTDARCVAEHCMRCSHLFPSVNSQLLRSSLYAVMVAQPSKA